MSNQPKPPSSPLPSPPKDQSSPAKPRFLRVRNWLRSRAGRIVFPIATLLVGIVFGIAAVLLFGVSSEGSKSAVQTPAKGDIIVEADKAFLTQLVKKNLNNSGMAGQIENVDLNLARGNQLMVRGEDVFNVLGINVIRPFTFVVQFYVNSCDVQMHIVHADFSNIPVTGFAQSFESQMNQQLKSRPEGLPGGFQYCATGVHTEPSGIFVTYSATPD